MTYKSLLFAPVLFAAAVVPAVAADLTFNFYADARLAAPPTDGSYLYGDLGKLRFGYDDGSPSVHFTEALADARLQLTPEIVATATGRFDPNYGPALDLLEGWVRYRPVSTSEWVWSVKAGAFFPPMSLENEEIGWTSFWTITPSAINSWVGAELRTIGTEGTLAWRRNGGTVTLVAALFGWNENAGELISFRGWNMDDRVTGLYEHTRLPDATATLLGATPPLHTQLFKQFDQNPGWYVDLSWEPEDIGGFEVMRYDNNADPSATRGDDVAWRTSFWDAGFRRQHGIVTVLAQAMDGATLIRPAPSFRLDTNFRSAYALLGVDLDKWWFAARADWFQTRTEASAPLPLSEDGHAATVAANWQPRNWVRFSAEFLLSDSTRAERAITGDRTRQIEKQFQLALRLYD
ncbi:MAG: hypothetical protein JOZ55_02955 [Alphaproteobacteria bacterium]|nr:hypothetical protein [Alphaproteobacteria bacterium]